MKSLVWTAVNVHLWTGREFTYQSFCGLIQVICHLKYMYNFNTNIGFKSRLSSLSVIPPPSYCSSMKLHDYLTIIPRARMGSESIPHEAEGRMGY